jgi:RimJ/RimL family protein N-acetyltransferase
MKNTNNTTGKQVFTIRYPKASDWKKLWTFINQLSQEKTYITYQGETISQTQEKKYLKGILQQIAAKQAIQLVVEINGQIVGSANFNLKPRSENHLGVIGISILDGFRGKGIGSTLLSKLLLEAKLKLPTAKIALLQVMSNNETAQQLYAKMGFIQCGCIPNGERHRGKFVDTILMYKNV